MRVLCPLHSASFQSHKTGCWKTELCVIENWDLLECLRFLLLVPYSLFLSTWRHQKRHQELFLGITLRITYYVLCFGSNRTKTQHIISNSKNYSRYVGLRISSGTGAKIVSSRTFFSSSIIIHAALIPSFYFILIFTNHSFFSFFVSCIDRVRI